MAVQNFLAGGYIGKLGETVGQRWRNKRTIRVHVPTNNSKTPAQLETRDLFKIANRLAQQAYNFNKGAAVWQSPDNNEWSLRVGTAMKRLKAGLPEIECIPYYPDAINQNINIALVAFDTASHFSNLSFVNNTVAMPLARAMQFNYYVYDIASGQMVTKNITRNYTKGEQFNMMIPNDGSFLWVNSSWVEGFTLYDQQFGNMSVTLQRRQLADIIPLNIHVPVAFSTPNFNSTSKNVQLTASIPNTQLLFKDISVNYTYSSSSGVSQNAIAQLQFLNNASNTVTLSLAWNYNTQYLTGNGITQQNITINSAFFNIVFNIPAVAIVQSTVPAQDVITLTLNNLTQSANDLCTLNITPSSVLPQFNLTLTLYAYNTRSQNRTVHQLQATFYDDDPEYINFTMPENCIIGAGCYVEIVQQTPSGLSTPIVMARKNYTISDCPIMTIGVYNFLKHPNNNANEMELYFLSQLRFPTSDPPTLDFTYQLRNASNQILSNETYAELLYTEFYQPNTGWFTGCYVNTNSYQTFSNWYIPSQTAVVDNPNYRLQYQIFATTVQK